MKASHWAEEGETWSFRLKQRQQTETRRHVRIQALCGTCEVDCRAIDDCRQAVNTDQSQPQPLFSAHFGFAHILYKCPLWPVAFTVSLQQTKVSP